MIRVLFLALLVGCAVPDTIGCAIDTPMAVGRGVIIGPFHAVTVCHIVSNSNICTIDGRPAHVVMRKAHLTEVGKDGLALLELDHGRFPKDRIAVLAAKSGRGFYYLPARGKTEWPWGVMPGDSGSPILDEDGHVVGLVRAVSGRGEPLNKTILGDGDH